MVAPPGTLGVLGGMGPAATADFLRRLAEVTPAERDQDHIPVILYGDPTTPDRSDAFEHGGEDPLPKLLAGIRFLSAAGVEAIAIPCNSAHLWFDEMQAATSVPILHIADAVTRRLEAIMPASTTVGLLGTEGTLHSGLYQRRLEPAGFSTLVPDDGPPIEGMMAGIRAVKAGEIAEGADHLIAAGTGLVERGADAVVVACTDISVALADHDTVAGVPIVDANSELAIMCTLALLQASRSGPTAINEMSRPVAPRTR